ncbi:MAG TPA: PfkB family carbohydrate kinase [Protaetiibacter sp.]|nr:PfkB family carbohydrate kinase [Protaetiibacter sp.]
MTARVVVIGDALIDELVDDEGTAHHVGGSALNVAVGLSILGVPASLVAMVGDDVDGALIRGHLADFGVELLPTITPRGTGIARSDRVDGEPHYSFSESMVRRTIDFDNTQCAAIADADIVAVSGFPFDVPPQVELLEEAVAGRPHVAVDPNPRPGMLHDADAFRRALEGFGGIAQLIKLGDDDARLLWNEPVADVAPRLLARYPYVLATEGKAGASIRIGDARWRHLSLVTPDAVVDTMGAGDSVFAAVLSQVAIHGIRDIDWFDTLELAMRIAAATVAEPGALLRRPRG